MKPKSKINPRRWSLSREIFEAALAYRRKREGFNDGSGWKGLSHGQVIAWRGVGLYVARNFKRR